MKKATISILLVIFVFSNRMTGQVINVNPDPNGEPWWAGGALASDPGDWSDAIDNHYKLQSPV